MNRPSDSNFTQQRLKTRPATFNPIYFSVALIIIGIIFIPTGTDLISISNDVYEDKITYDDGSNYDCHIKNSNDGKQCQQTFTISKHIDGPVFVYYEVENFYQNHRRYYKSYSPYQLLGQNLGDSDVKLACNPLYKNGTLLLNPCGLIANSFFNDVISLDSAASSTSSSKKMREDGISVYSDRQGLFKQVDGFKSKKVDDLNTTTCDDVGLDDDCEAYTDASTGQSYLFTYPDNHNVQYLYESYPNQISPIKGVTDEHFIVWMRTAGLPTFRKLYGIIDGDLDEGDQLVFNITANYQVTDFDGSKSLIITNVGEFGGKNIATGQAFVTVGTFSMFMGIVVLTKTLLF